MVGVTELAFVLDFAAKPSSRSITLYVALRIRKLSLSLLNCFLYVFLGYWHGVPSALASTPLHGMRGASSTRDDEG